MHLFTFLLVVSSIMSAVALYAQKPTLEQDLSCVKYLELPTRGLLAAGAGGSGTVHAVAEVGGDGQMAKLRLTGGNSGLQGEVRVAMNLSRFTSSCSNRSVEFVFVFALEDPPTESVIPPGVRFVPPNRFDLVFRKVKPNYDPVRPRGLKDSK